MSTIKTWQESAIESWGSIDMTPIGAVMNYLNHENSELRAALELYSAKELTTKERYDISTKDCVLEPLEALRYFCSLSMNSRDWFDVEPLFDAVSELIEELK